MGHGDIDIRADKVKRVGADLQAEARYAQGRIAHSLDGSDAVQSGWESAQVLGECARAWETHMQALVGEMAAIGTNLQSAAQGHTNNDVFVQGLLRGIDGADGLGGS
ncbi:hypothetical protein SRB5_20960 [Streptomyces sp. RB5]|uniref:Uncharacterized protein n=1 Tax=Streptomyces smaragdinus TaxID=2585196 RepID=A0A7K0CES3_9ACTN|nr:hypothetical protein [Streptomyces smaragdinus]MQY11968.1 hypothetical protein [Streptomyces smaragdinus]